MEKKEITFDGSKIESLESFYDEVSRNLFSNIEWGRNLDAFNDVLNGGFGFPEEDFVLIWKNSQESKEKLGFTETIKWLNEKRKTVHPSHNENLLLDIQNAENQQGETLFDMLIDIIKSHRNIELRLE